MRPLVAPHYILLLPAAAKSAPYTSTTHCALLTTRSASGNRALTLTLALTLILTLTLTHTLTRSASGIRPQSAAPRILSWEGKGSPPQRIRAIGEGKGSPHGADRAHPKEERRPAPPLGSSVTVGDLRRPLSPQPPSPQQPPWDAPQRPHHLDRPRPASAAPEGRQQSASATCITYITPTMGDSLSSAMSTPALMAPTRTSDRPLPPYQPAKRPPPRPVSASTSNLELLSSTPYRMRPWSSHSTRPIWDQIAPARSLDPGERLVRHTTTETW